MGKRIATVGEGAGKRVRAATDVEGGVEISASVHARNINSKTAPAAHFILLIPLELMTGF